MPTSPHPLLPDHFGDFLAADDRVAHFAGGRLVVDGTNPGLRPVTWDAVPVDGFRGGPPPGDEEAWARIDGSLYCGSAMFEKIIRDLRASDAARRRAIYEAQLTSHVQGPCTAPVPGSTSTPVTSWAALARAVGISLDTLSRRRAEWKVKEDKPYFSSEDDARAWFREHQRSAQPPPKVPKTPGRAPRPPTTQATGGTTLADLRATRAPR